MHRLSLLFGALLLVVCAGCGTNPIMGPDVAANNGGGGRDTVVVTPPPAPTNGNCGEINTGAYNVTRGQPLKYLFSYYFSGPFHGRMFTRNQNYREGGGHTNQDIQYYAVRDGDGQTVVIKRAGDSCGVLADTTGMNGPVTRYVGEVNLEAGAWTFYAVHGSRVSCWTPSGSGSGPVDVVDTQFEWCYR